MENALTKKVISMWLDDYDNIFSDFDPRPYSNRELSDDFLAEAKKVTRSLKSEPAHTYELHLLMPVGKRKSAEESIVKQRLHHYFLGNFHDLKRQHAALIKSGIAFAVVGIVLMLASGVMDQNHDFGAWMSYVKVILEPAGWFLTWFGLDQIFYGSRALQSELSFHHKLASANIKFESYQTASNHGDFASQK